MLEVRWLVEAAVAKGSGGVTGFSVEERVDATLAYMAGLNFNKGD